MLKYGLFGVLLGFVACIMFVLCEMFVSSNLYANMSKSGMLFIIGLLLITYFSRKAERI